MQFKTLTVLACAVGAMAAPEVEKRQIPATASYNTISVLQVLQTALPETLIQEALTNSASVYSEIASQFAAGSTPTWFTALPSDIQTLLIPAALATNSAALSSAIANVTSTLNTATAIPGLNATAIVGSNGTAIVPVATGNSTVGGNSTTGGNSTLSTTRLTSSATSTGSRSGSSGSSTAGSSGTSRTSSGSTSASSGGASLPTAIYGMGLAGAVGLVGVLAL